MPTTSNFGWTTPADTDLVKDGAAAIRTLGNGIDTSLVDLKGGTTGQILSKNSNTDLDYIWINNDQGDITAVTAGTGLTGGGTTGAVTLTNDMATTITAAGDIVVGTGSGTYDNLPIGTTGQILTADTTVSPYKVKWAAPAATNGPAFAAYLSSNQTVTGNVWTKIQFNTEEFDTDNCYDNATNYRFTPNKAGKYQISATFSTSGTGYLRIYKNGSAFKSGNYNAGSNGYYANMSTLVDLNGTTDYIEIYGLNSTTTVYAGQSETYVAATWIRS